jgi:hypothetical protein
LGTFTFNNSNIGSAGDHAVNYGHLYNQWSQSGTSMNLENLGAELTRLKAELARQRAAPADEATTGDDATTDTVKEAASAAITEAAAAALQGDGKTAFSYLSKAGTWAFEVAKTIGVPVALAALKTAIGLGP